MSDAMHAAVLRWMAAAEHSDVTVSCSEAKLPGSIVLNCCLADVPLVWLVELAAHSTVHVAVDHCENAASTTERLRNLATVTERVCLDGGPTHGPQTHYAAPPTTEAPLTEVSFTPEVPQGNLAERLAVALAALPPALVAH